MEQAIAGATRALSDQLTAHVLGHIVADPALQAQASAAARQAGRYRSRGKREVEVTLLGGGHVRLLVEYLKPDQRQSKGRKKSKRGKGGSGLYPVLAVLGISLGVTPALVAEVCAQATDSDSLRAAKAALARRGIELGLRRSQRIVNQFSGRAVQQREQWLEQMRTQPAQAGPLRGKRIVVSMDGGRLRERRSSGRGRRRQATGRRRYDAPWRVCRTALRTGDCLTVRAEDGKQQGGMAEKRLAEG
jgi:hypothetical protein